MTTPNFLTGAPQGDPARSPVAVLGHPQGGTGTSQTPAAPAAVKPANPTATTATALKMMGCGSDVTHPSVYTPASSGKVLVTVTGWVQVATGAVAGTLGARYGTGAAPANGDAVTGTRFGTLTDPTDLPPTTAQGTPFTFTDILTLTAGVQAWFDVAAATANASDAVSLTNVTFTFVETS